MCVCVWGEHVRTLVSVFETGAMRPQPSAMSSVLMKRKGAGADGDGGPDPVSTATAITARENIPAMFICCSAQCKLPT